MIVSHLKNLVWLGCLVSLVGCTQPDPVSPPTTSDSSSPPSSTESLVLGDISDEPTKKIEEYQPLADYLGASLNQVGEVKIAPDMATMAQWLASGEVDIYFDSPYPAMIVSNRSNARPILRRWKDGVAEYSSIIFARRDSGLTTIDDLQGHVIAFEEVFSTSGYMLPLAYLTRAGLNVVEKDDALASVATDEIGYVFSEDDRNAIQWVLSQKVVAAASASSDIPDDLREQITILLETDPLPRQIVMLSPTIDAETQATIETVLMNLDESEEGQIILEQFEETSQFDQFPQGADNAFAEMRELYELVNPQ